MLSHTRSVDEMPTTQQLYAEHGAELRAYAARRLPSRSAVDDVLQDAFLRMHLHLARLTRPEAARAWAFSIVRSSIVDHVRKHGPTAAHDEREEEAEVAEEENAGVTTGLSHYVASLVDELPAHYRRAVHLIELEGRGIKEAAALEGVSETAMKSRIQRARGRLRTLTDRCCSIEVDARGKVIECTPRGGGRC